MRLYRSLAGGPGWQGPPTDHFDGREFHNATGPAGRTLAEILRWRRTAQPKRWPEWVENRAHPRLPAALKAGEIALTFVNHITFLVQLPGLNVLTDPVFAERTSPFRRVGPRRVRAPGIGLEALPDIDLVLLSHNHYDHLDLEALLQLDARHRPHIVTGLGNRGFLEQFGLMRVTELDWWQACAPDTQAPCRVGFLPARHWSGRGLRNRNRTLWGGLWLEAGGRSLFFAGDTGYDAHFTAIRTRCGSPDLALLPIGAYEPRWFMGPQHMDPAEAVRAHIELDACVSVATHFGCFQLTDEGIDDPVQELLAARERASLSPEAFQVLETGETRLYPPESFAGPAPGT